MHNHLSYSDVLLALKDIASHIQDHRWNFHGIVAITRGGLVPAGILSQYLTIKTIRTICLESYSEKNQQESIRSLYEFQDEKNAWLVVDDLADSGRTLDYARKCFPKSFMVVPYAKPQGKPFVDYFAKLMPQEEWLVFPWETDWKSEWIKGTA